MITLVALLAVLLQPAPASDWPTLREVLAKHGLEGAQVAGIDDIEKVVNSYAVGSDDEWLGVAYYWHQGDSFGDLRVRTLDKRTGRWQLATFDPDALRGGSALRMGRAGQWIYLDLHNNPSNGALVVLSDDLRVKRRLAGWSSLLLADGRVVYENNMIHFAPFHPGAVSLYDPRTDRDEKLYPFGPILPPFDSPQDRSIVKVVPSGPTRIAISVIEQDLRWGSDATAEPVGPERRYTLTCDLSVSPAKCMR